MASEYRFTVFTSCYNSARFIDRVYNSLQAQTFRNFEWLVFNDASTDSTLEILRSYEKSAGFPVRIIDNVVNKMLYSNFNTSFEEAKGELMVFIGHDDALMPQALERMDAVWTRHGQEDIAGIWCRCQDQFGNPVGSLFPEDLMVSNYFTLFEKYIYGSQERFGCTRTEVLRKFPFDLPNGKSGEGFLWCDIGMEYKTIYINDILRVYYIEEENRGALTKRSRTQVAEEVYLFYLEFINRYQKKVSGAHALKLRFHFAHAFYRILNRSRFWSAFDKINSFPARLIYLLMTPPAFLVSRFKR